MEERVFEETSKASSRNARTKGRYIKMGILDDLRNRAQGASAGLQTKVARFKNDKFLKGTIAACALIVSADGELLDEELDGTSEFINSHELLACFRPDEKAALTEAYLRKAAGKISQVELFGYVAALKSDPEAAATCIELAIALANADGEFHESEQKMVKRLCNSLGLDASVYI